MIKKLLFLDPRNEVLKIISSSELDVFEVTYDGQLLFGRGRGVFTEYDFIGCINAANRYNLHILYCCKFFGLLTFVVKDGLYDWSNAYLNPKHVNRGLVLYEFLPCDVFFSFNDGSNSLILHSNPIVKIVEYLPYRMRVDVDSGKDVIIKDSSLKKLLISTANSPCLAIEETPRLIHLIDETIKAAEEIFDVIAFRIFDEKILSNISSNFKNHTERSFAEVVSEFDVLVTTPSSISVEAMALGVPVIHFDYRDAPLLFQSAWRIHSSVNISQTLRSACDREAERIYYQNFVISETSSHSCSISETIQSEVPSANSFVDLGAKNAINILESSWNFNFYIIAKRILRLFRLLKRKLS
jgi:hypothetical protein